jgi:hypothetical protein
MGFPVGGSAKWSLEQLMEVFAAYTAGKRFKI